jgi:hypothetical protein
VPRWTVRRSLLVLLTSSLLAWSVLVALLASIIW